MVQRILTKALHSYRSAGARWKRWLGIGFLVMIGSMNTVFAQTPTDHQMDATMDNLFGSHKPYHDFFDQLQKAVAASDKKTVSHMVRYPITVGVMSKQRVTLRSEKQFISHYNQIFTPRLVNVVKDEKYSTLFARDQGVSIGGGAIWYSRECLDNACTKQSEIKIITFNN